jgi:D-alanine-D-alanine ligase
MNKVASSKLFRAYGLDVPEFGDISRHGDWAYFKVDFGYPVVVKPVDRGSSVGVNIVRDEAALRDALCRVFDFSHHAMVQKYISGRELTCAVIEDERGALPLPPTEIIPKSHFFDYESKYSPLASKEITPAHLTREETLEVQRIAVSAHQIVNASGVSRTDMILGNDGHIYVLEINTIPGMTPQSLLPQAAAAHGLGMDRLLDHIIASGLRRFGI